MMYLQFRLLLAAGVMQLTGMCSQINDCNAFNIYIFCYRCVLIGQCFGRHELRVLDMKKLESSEVCVTKVS